MTQPTLFTAIDRYTDPLCDDDRRRLFKQWLSINAEYVAMMVGWAEDIAESGESVSVQRLFERARWERGLDIQPIIYIDIDGKMHRYGYKLNHNDRALFGRWLQATHPGMRVNLRKSRFDATDDERDLTHQELIDGFADWLKGIDIDRQIFGGGK